MRSPLRVLLLFTASCLSVHAATALTLMAIGDWGGDNDNHPSNAAEIAAATGMSKVASELGAQAVLLLGDNFYTHGVDSNTSSRFHDTFEDVYKPSMFNGLPFYVVAGNHDHLGSVQAQLDYHGSARWRFPSLYYSLPFAFNSSTGVARTLELLLIDTCSLAGVSDDDCQGCTLPGPPSEQEAEAQWDWIEQRLAKSTADFLWVGGHYPIYSAGNDGTTSLLVQRLLPLLKKHGAHYISGHDHMHEHIEVDNVNMFITGPGRFCCYGTRHLDSVPKGAIKYLISGDKAKGPSIGPAPTADVLSGFSSLQIDDTVTLTMYNQDGDVLYTAPPIPPRPSAFVEAE